MFKDFFKGAAFVSQGLSAFYSNRYLWKYAALPMGLLIIVYVSFVQLLIWSGGLLTDKVEQLSASLPSWISFILVLLTGVLIGVAAFLLILSTAAALYEMFGSLFFDSMVEKFEKEKYRYFAPKATGKQTWLFFRDGFVWGVGTGILFLLLFILGFFLPIVGQIILICVIGYRLAVACLLSTAFNHRLGLQGLKRLVSGRTALVAGYGIAAYLLMMIPFLAILVLPGIIIGGTLLYHSAWDGD